MKMSEKWERHLERDNKDFNPYYIGFCHGNINAWKLIERNIDDNRTV